MKEAFVNVKLIAKNKIHLIVFENTILSEDLNISLIKNDVNVGKMKVAKKSSYGALHFFELIIPGGYEYQTKYEVLIPSIGILPVNVNAAIDFDDFDEDFYYDGDDLGARYYKDHTTFKVWAPLASSVLLKLIKNNKTVLLEMHKAQKGIYELDVKGDLENALYHYIVTNSGIQEEANDPYAFSYGLNSEYSAVVDIQKIKKDHQKYVFSGKPLDSIIYEVSVRDFTVQNSTDIINKAKYLGMVEKGRLTKKGKPAGLDYIKLLGFTHVQLLPVLDFARVKDDDQLSSYNWGYDPLSFFALEGSYSTKPSDPSNRMEEFNQMVKGFHKENIGVILDLVYNHVFDFEDKLWQKIVPNYYFRRDRNLRFINGTGCGNDVASEKPMVRKMLVDSAKFLVDVYDVDGFRFDLMGMIDIETCETIRKECKKLKPGFFMYGEGWDMSTGLKREEKTAIINAFKIPEIGFFNDSFRDIAKGSSFDLAARGFVNGDLSYAGGMVFSLLGSVTDYCFPRRFLKPSQSINYIECHDNHTLFDKIKNSNPEEDDELIYTRINFANTLNILSIGVPFMHMGQEIGLTKYGDGNSYISGDKFNKFDYKALENRFEMALFIKSCIELRKELKLFHIDDAEAVDEMINDVKILNGGLIILDINKKYLPEGMEEMLVGINPDTEPHRYELDDYYTYYFGKGGICMLEDQMKIKSWLIAPLDYMILIKKTI